MKRTIEERRKYAEVIAKAWVDEEFKARLLADPAATLKQSGIEIPERMTVKVVERTSDEILLSLPPKPTSGGEELSEEVLSRIAAGDFMDQSSFEDYSDLGS